MILTIALGVISTTIVGCNRSIDNNAIVSTIDGFEITLGLANFATRFNQGQYETFTAPMFGLDPNTMWTDEVDGVTQEDLVKESILEDLENLVLIYQRKGEFGISLSDEQVSTIQNVAQAFIDDNDAAVLEAVSGEMDIIIQYLELITIGELMFEAMREDVDTEVSDEEALQKEMEYITISFVDFDEDGTPLIMSEEEMDEVRMIMAELHAEVEADPNRDLNIIANHFGQEVITMTFDSETVLMVHDLVAQVDALENEGDITDLIKADDGVTVGKLTSLLDREATDHQKEIIIEERRQERFESLLNQWRQEANINHDERVWARVSLADLGIVIVRFDVNVPDENLDDGFDLEYEGDDDYQEDDDQEGYYEGDDEGYDEEE